MKKLLPLIVALSLLSPLITEAAISFVQGTSTNCGTVTTCTLKFGSNSGAGNLYVVGIRTGSASLAAPTSVTSTQSDTFATTTQGFIATGLGNTWLYYAKNTSGSGAASTSITVNLPASVTLRFAIMEYSGLDTTSPLDVSTVGSSTTGTTLSVTTSTTNNASEVIVGLGTTQNAAGDNLTAGAGYTREVNGTCGSANCLAMEDQIVSVTTTTANTIFTNANSGAWGDIMATFKAQAAATSSGTALGPTLATLSGATVMGMTIQ